jgi:hypothetical protein
MFVLLLLCFLFLFSVSTVALLTIGVAEEGGGHQH